tara:strand:+ start:51 stop:212 length:162 start_codon:yes stop_codon:yes gene_type:complete
MFALLMSKVFELIAVGKEADAGLQASHPFVQFFNDPENLDNGNHSAKAVGAPY